MNWLSDIFVLLYEVGVNLRPYLLGWYFLKVVYRMQRAYLLRLVKPSHQVEGLPTHELSVKLYKPHDFRRLKDSLEAHSILLHLGIYIVVIIVGQNPQ